MAFQTPVVTVPILTNEDKVVTAVLTSVPDVGRVTDVLPVAVKVCVKAPACVTFPAIVIVDVPLLTPVPPLAAESVPLSVIAPVVAELGVKPVVPALKDVTPPVDAAHVAVVPLDVRT